MRMVHWARLVKECLQLQTVSDDRYLGVCSGLSLLYHKYFLVNDLPLEANYPVLTAAFKERVDLGPPAKESVMSAEHAQELVETVEDTLRYYVKFYAGGLNLKASFWAEVKGQH